MPSYILPHDILAGQTPSVQDGIAADVEKNNLIFVCELLSVAGGLLRLYAARCRPSSLLVVCDPSARGCRCIQAASGRHNGADHRASVLPRQVHEGVSVSGALAELAQGGGGVWARV